MQSLLTRDVVPPPDNLDRHFRYTDPATGFTIAARDYFTWITKARAHRTANGLPIPIDFEAQMENQLCDQLPPGWCERAPDQGWVNSRFTWEDIKNGMKAFASLMAGGFDFVPQEEADRRARICATCYLNQPVPGCSSCGKIASFAVGDVAKRKTEWDSALKACSVCHCVNSVQVHFPQSALDTTDTTERQALYPAFCWKKK